MGIRQLFDRKTVRNEKTFNFEIGLSKDVLLMAKRVFRWLQGKEIPERKGTGASRALPKRYNKMRQQR